MLLSANNKQCLVLQRGYTPWKKLNTASFLCFSLLNKNPKLQWEITAITTVVISFLCFLLQAASAHVNRGVSRVIWLFFHKEWSLWVQPTPISDAIIWWWPAPKQVMCYCVHRFGQAKRRPLPWHWRLRPWPTQCANPIISQCRTSLKQSLEPTEPVSSDIWLQRNKEKIWKELFKHD